ncbi:MAG: hypothetical protein QGH91_05570 [Candidatus Marinimicrobia bacterium]|nr:hypothetical protein [Candidatus Neomarinimicrobiota bacterium]MDP7217187.1 hypothetical protein [Candidatus Neomarinimicrobiota bacterium]MDP7437262.1 hypothetical protein [Candidatus Neomarinimicrobiota bacterium]MDP7653941.1 hypothetical protein [Candidatus Neomarinimicrobiota bacterium]HBN45166.1 hypothetical protein [Candidatus Neomarinimicrobiota bacterium]
MNNYTPHLYISAARWFRLVFIVPLLVANPGARAQDLNCADAEYYENGNIEFCRLSAAETISGQNFPRGTGVHFNTNGDMDWVFLPEDMVIQGYLCRGGGHAFQTSFHPNGQLKTAWLAADEIIQGIPCAKFRFLTAVFAGLHGKNGGTTFHDNGQLSYCELSQQYVIEGKKFKKGAVVKFAADGKLRQGH